MFAPRAVSRGTLMLRSPPRILLTDLANPGATTRQPSMLLIIAITASGTLSLHIFLPALPAVASEFAASPATVQLTLTLYLIGLAFGQLLYGPLSDRFGRRP